MGDNKKSTPLEVLFVTLSGWMSNFLEEDLEKIEALFIVNKRTVEQLNGETPTKTGINHSPS